MPILPEQLSTRRLGWRWYSAAGIFLFGFIGLAAGTGVSERDLTETGLLTKAYYAVGLFVVGGLDIGTPVGGPLWARISLWIAYFGAPFITASAVMEAIIQVLEPGRWQLRRIQNHIVVFGSGRLTLSYLRLLRRVDPDTQVVVVDADFDPVREQELKHTYRTTTLVGDLTHRFLLRRLRLKKAKRVMLLGDNDYNAFEAATRILDIAPALEGRIILHCHNLRFMRSVQNTQLAERCEVFNTYNLAAAGLVHDQLIAHFKQTPTDDLVVMAGFGRFGQSILEELQFHAAKEISEVIVIDRDADRRVLVVDEQQKINTTYQRRVLEGDIAHPEVWRQLTTGHDLHINQPTIVLGTGEEQNNMRTALWIKQKYPNALIIVRTNDQSDFAEAVSAEHGIKPISITRLVEDNIPQGWLT